MINVGFQISTDGMIPNIPDFRHNGVPTKKYEESHTFLKASNESHLKVSIRPQVWIFCLSSKNMETFLKYMFGMRVMLITQFQLVSVFERSDRCVNCNCSAISSMNYKTRSSNFQLLLLEIF